MFIDSHCHLDFPEFQARLPEVLANMKSANVTHALCVSIDIPDFPKVLQLAQEHPHLYASVGVHPDYEDTPEPTVEFLVDTANKHPKIIAIGETGLDYYRMGIAVMSLWSGNESVFVPILEPHFKQRNH